jgi:RNA polymerase sigma-70 factor, ECF subfamily
MFFEPFSETEGLHRCVSLHLVVSNKGEKLEGPSDAELVARATRGDSRAEETLFRRHAPGVLTLARRLTRDRDDADDVLQETFEIAFKHLEELRDARSLRSWLLQIAVRRVQRRFRKKRWLAWIGIGTPSDPETLVEQAARDVSGEQRAELALLDVALDRLGDNERLAWMLRHVEGKDLEETAELCGCSLATVKRRIAAADSHVRAHLGTES